MGRLLLQAVLGYCAAVTAISPLFSAEPPPASAEQLEFFEQKVRPLLAARCFECHGAKKQEFGLRLDTWAGVSAGSENGLVVVPGKVNESKLAAAVGYEGDIQMPPDKKLSAEEIAVLRKWIEIGAPWPREAVDAKTLSGDALLDHARANHWAFQPIKMPALPELKQPAAAAGPIDRFILARLHEKGIEPSSTAGRLALIRRMSFDLIGLPPTPDEVDAFVADESPDAVGRLADRLLASPHHGERWGRHWLDVARYADTRGYAFGRERRFAYAYTYRDYVIRALNSDLPFDQFVTEQLAADRLQSSNGDKRALAALGFLTVGRHFDNQPDDMDDRIDTVTRGLLGLTVGCARCHDHKYDPIPSEDYYSLYGVFASTTEPAELPVIGESTELAAFAEFQKKFDELKKKHDDYLSERHQEVIADARKRAAAYLEIVATRPAEMFRNREFAMSLRAEDIKPRLLERWRAYIAPRAKPKDAVFGAWGRLVAIDDAKFADLAPTALNEIAQDDNANPLVKAALAAKPPKSRKEVGKVYGELLADVAAKADQKDPPPSTDELRKVMFADDSPTSIPRDQARDFQNRAVRNKLSELKKAMDSHQVKSPGAPPRAMMLVDAAKPFDPYVFLRGDQFRRGKKVPRQFLKVLAPDRKPFGDGSGRLDLAREITSDANPLTARVIANRVWMYHLGQPLVPTPSDFGLRSDPPSHPELLDYLASRLREQDWSLKQLHREIVSSATYQQVSVARADAAAIDPENRLAWRANPRRLEFEALRDALAAASGSLDARMTGPPADLIARPFSTRRAVYGFIDRQDLPNLFRVFDFASPDQSTAQRPQTTVPQQALFLMNSQFVAEQAGRLVGRTEVQAATETAQRVEVLYRLVYGRAPTDEEREIGAAYIAAATPTDRAWPRYAQALLLANEFCFID